jgi:hypothetical protein
LRIFAGRAAENYEAHFVPTIATPAAHELFRAAGLRPSVLAPGGRVVINTPRPVQPPFSPDP